MKKFNLNNQVKVKLTPRGADIYYHYFDRIKEFGKTVFLTREEERRRYPLRKEKPHESIANPV